MRCKQGLCSRPEAGKPTQCRGKTARAAAVYDFKLRRAILVGFRKQVRRDGTCRHGFIGMLERGQEREDLPRHLPVSLVDAKEIEKLPIYELADAKGLCRSSIDRPIETSSRVKYLILSS